MEGKLLSHVVARLANADGLDPNTTIQIQELFTRMETLVDGLGFCLSEEGDLLSQWRGYAGDAAGVAIGFDKTYLDWLIESNRQEKRFGLKLNQVVYEETQQNLLVMPTYAEIKQAVESGALRTPGRRSLLDLRSNEEIEKEDEAIRLSHMDVSAKALSLFGHIYLLKSAAFAEEREWRLVSYFVKVADDLCSFRAANAQLVPYRSFELRELQRRPVTTVVLGPKHLTPVHAVQSLMQQAGFGNVQVVKSSATYR